MSIADQLELKILNKVLRNVDFAYTAIFASLHTADPGETGTAEVTNAGGSTYARQTATFAAAAAGACVSNVDLTFANMPGVTVTHLGLWSASTAGDALWFGPLNASRLLVLGDTYKIPSTNLTVSLE